MPWFGVGLVGAVLLAVTGVSAGASGEGLPVARPERVGMSSVKLARIGQVMEEYVRSGSFPGMTVAVVREGNIAYLESFGWADIAKAEPVRPDTIFRIYSMSKPVTAAAVMMLYEEGKFSLDDPVSRYLPAFKNVNVYQTGKSRKKDLTPRREISIRDLLRHTSGLGYGWDKDPVSEMYQKANLFDPQLTIEQAVDRLAALPLYFEPGSNWQYSVSIDVLGRLVEVWSGLTLEEFFNQRIFTPLGMKDTGFFVPSDKLGRFTSCYRLPEKGKLEAVPEDAAFGRYDREKNRLLSGGGGLVSTTADYLRFAQMLLNGGELDGVRLLGPKTVELMSMNHLPDGVKLHWDKLQGHGYGFAVSVLTDLPKSLGMGSVGDWGWDGAASTYFRIDPSEKLVLLLMTHRMPCDTEIQVRLKTLVYQAIERPADGGAVRGVDVR